jgi:hypothetical protein
MKVRRNKEAGDRQMGRFRPLAGKWDESSLTTVPFVAGQAFGSFRPLAGKWDERACG